MTRRRPTRNDRGVSITVNYVLGLSIAFIALTGILLMGSNFVSDQRETSIRTELEVLGEQIAADLAMTDRLVETGEGSTTVEVGRSLPDRVSGSSYTISLEGGKDPYVVVETNRPDISVQVEFTNNTEVELDRTSGGPIVIQYNPGPDTISVEDTS